MLEEAGWALGGLTLARAAFGPGVGVVVLGVVWSAWHVIPSRFGVMFPELQHAPPLMLATFLVTCVVYRALLTRLRDRAGTWLAAAAGHAAPNVALSAVLCLGLDLRPAPGGPWMLFPAPGGVVFLVAASVALHLMLRRSGPVRGDS